MSVYLQSNLPPDDNRGPGLIAYWWITLVFTAVIVGLRVYVRVFIRRSPGWDDWLICIAMVTDILGTGLATASAYYGLGRHMVHLSVYELRHYLKWLVATQMAAIPVSVFAKISICIFVVRITPARPHRSFVVSIWLFVSFLAATSITTVFILGLQCLPIRRLWNSTVPGKCLDVLVVKCVFQGYGITGCLTDFACAFVFPVFILKTQQVEKGTRNAVIFLLGLAILPGISCILKTYYADVIIDPDYSWVAYKEGIWISTEIHSGIVIACLPILHPWIATYSKALLARLEGLRYTGPSLYYATANYSAWRSEAPLFSRRAPRRYQSEKRQSEKPRNNGHDHRGERRRKRTQKVTFYNTNPTTTNSTTYSGKLDYWFDMSKLFRQRRSQKQTFFNATATDTTTATTATTNGVSKVNHCPNPRNPESFPESFRTVPPPLPPKLPPTPPPKADDFEDEAGILQQKSSGTRSAQMLSSATRTPSLNRDARLSLQPSGRRTPPAHGQGQGYRSGRVTPADQTFTGRLTPAGNYPGRVSLAGRASGRVTPTERPSGRANQADRPSGRVTPAGQGSGRVTPAEQRPTGRSTPAGNYSGRVSPARQPSGDNNTAAKLSSEPVSATSQQPIRYSLMPHEDLGVFPTRSDSDFEERVVRRMQALISPGPSRSNTPAMGAPTVE